MKLQVFTAGLLLLGLAGCGSQAERKLAATEKAEKQQVDQQTDLNKKTIDNKIETQKKELDASKKNYDASIDMKKKELDAERKAMDKKLNDNKDLQKETITKQGDTEKMELKNQEKAQKNNK